MTSSANTVWTRDTSILIQKKVNIDGFMVVDVCPYVNKIFIITKRSVNHFL